jgi:sugar transferase (PEP-CTERM system associated)
MLYRSPILGGMDVSEIHRAATAAAIDDLEDLPLGTQVHGAYERPAHAFAPQIDVSHLHITHAAPAAPALRGPRDMVRPLRLFHGHHHRLLLLGSLEACVVVAAFYAALILRFQAWESAVLADAVGPVWPRILLCAMIFPACLGSMGLYDLHQRAAFTGIAARIGVAVTMAEIALMCVFYAMPSLFVGRGVMGFTGAFAFVGLVTLRFAYLKVVDVELFKRRVVVWGAGQHAASIGTRMRRRADQRGYRVVAYMVAPGETPVVHDAKRISDHADVLAYLAQHRVEEVVVAMDDRRRGFPTALLRECRMRGIRVCDVVGFLEEESGHVNVDLARPSWFIFSEGFRCDLMRVSGKRAFDILIATGLLLATLPITLATAVAIWLEDRGPVLYRQTRVGQHGAHFRILKFRSMRMNAESPGNAVWASRNDPRVTRVGSFIRRTRIDEIPQAINVLLGHMSFVGPRPERPEFVESLARTIPLYAERHFVKPGITGWAQVRFPYGSSEDDSRQKLGFDLYYVKNHDLAFDLVIMLRTVETVLFRVGSR